MRGCWSKKPPRAAPHWVHTSEYSENHLVIPTPHNTAQHLIRHHYTHQPVTNMDPEQEVNSVTEYSDTDIVTNHQSSWTKRSCTQTVLFNMANIGHGNVQRARRTWKCLCSLGIVRSPFLLIVPNLCVL